MLTVSPSARHVDAAVAALLVYVTATGIWEANLFPFWYDEIFTAVLAQLPSMADIVAALQGATDTSGPIYYLLVRASNSLVSDPETAARLPSVFAGTIVCAAVYLFARRDLGPMAASVAVLVMLLGRLYHGLAVEARAYAVALMFVCLAAVAWQRADRWWWTILLAVFGALAVGTHYYAIFACAAFGAAELVHSVRRRHLRVGVWLAISSAPVALAASWPLLNSLRTYYGETYWSKPTIGKALGTYDWAMFITLPGVGAGIALGLGLAMVLLFARLWRQEEDAGRRAPAPETVVLIAMLLASPLTVVAITTVMQGGFTSRYAVVMLAGLSLSAAYAARALAVRHQPMVALGLVAVFGMQEMVFWATGGEHNGRRQRPHLIVGQQAIRSFSHMGLPVAVEVGLDFLALDYYRSADDDPDLLYLLDVDATMKYGGSDSLDRDLLALQRYRPMNIVDFQAFRSEHDEFLLLSSTSAVAWWARRLLDERYTLTLVDRGPRHLLYRVRAPDATGRPAVEDTGTDVPAESAPPVLILERQGDGDNGEDGADPGGQPDPDHLEQAEVA